MFSDIGIRPSIIQNKRGEQAEFLNTAWTMQIVRGFILWAIACGMAYPISTLYESSVLFPLLCVIGSTAAIRGFQTTGYATSNRKINLGKLTVVELATTISGIVAMVIWAAVSPTVWALAGGGVISAIFSVALGHLVLNSHSHKIHWDRSSAKELIKFGKWIVLSSAITFAAQNGDRLVLPKVLSIYDLSYYYIAMMLSRLPVNIFGQIASKVLFPVYSESFNRGEYTKIAYAVRKFAMLSAPAYLVPAIFIIWSDQIIELLYDDRYFAAASPLAVLSIGVWFAMQRSAQSGLLLAVGDSRGSMIINLVKFSVGMPIAILLGVSEGLVGFCAGIAVSEAFSYMVQRHLVKKAIPAISQRLDILYILLLALIVLIKFIAVK